MAWFRFPTTSGSNRRQDSSLVLHDNTLANPRLITFHVNRNQLHDEAYSDPSRRRWRRCSPRHVQQVSRQHVIVSSGRRGFYCVAWEARARLGPGDYSEYSRALANRFFTGTLVAGVNLVSSQTYRRRNLVERPACNTRMVRNERNHRAGRSLSNRTYEQSTT